MNKHIFGLFLFFALVSYGWGAISYRSSSSASSTAGNAASYTLTINKPTGTAADDVLIASIAFRPSSSIITTPTGWTLIRTIPQSSGNSNYLAIYHRVAGSNEPATYSWTVAKSGPGTTGISGGIISFIGVDTTSPINIENGQTTSSSTTHPTPNVTTSVSNTMLVTSHEYASSETWSPPVGMTEAVDIASTSGAGGIALEMNYALQSSAGATGVKTATAAGSADTGAAHILALKPSLPIADYRFDNCTWANPDTFTDATGNYNGTAEALISTDGKICKAGDFTANSTADVVRLPNTLLSGLTNFTYSVWVKASSTGAQQELLQGVRNSATIDEVEFYLDSNDKVRVNIKGNGQDFGLTNNQITDNTWKHLAFTRNGGTMCLYINGALKQCQNGFSTGALSIDSGGLIIGQEQDSTGGGFSNTQDYQGLMDEITVFNRALSATDIQTLYTNQNNSNNYDGSSRTCLSCGTPTLSTCGTEDFSQYTAAFPFTNNWTIIKQDNYIPQIVNGKLMLTNLGANIATGVTLNGALPAANNYLEITFQSFAYGGSGADGITLTLSDAAVVPVAGAFGGSLGYAQKPGINGFAGGWLGFGLDEYGNFSNPADGGKSGGPGAVVDSVAVRGSGSGTTGYSYIAGTATLSPGIDQATEGPGYWYRMSIDTRNTSTLVKVERNTNINGTGSYSPLINWTNATQVAAAPANYRLSLTGSTGGSNNYHAADNFTLKAMSCGTVTVIPPTPTPSGRFDAWDSFRSINDRNISTKIVGKDFNITIASLNSTNSELQDFNGTVCARMVNSSGTAISSWNPPLLFNNQQTKVTTFNLNRAIGSVDYAKLDLHWKTNATDICPLSSETNNTIASDYFSVRPNAFTLSAPNAVAGTDFNITFSAPNFSTTASAEYNETAGTTFDVSYIEHNVSCRLPSAQFTPDLNSSWSFTNGSKTLTTQYNEVGVVDVNISDTAKICTSLYTRIDCDDANVSDGLRFTADLLPIGTTQAQIAVQPHHFDLNATLVNFGSGVFTYLSTDLNMSSKLDINATAKNEQNLTTLNYDKGCYAQTTTLNLNASAINNSLTQILYHEDLSNIDGNVSKSGPISIPFAKTIFTQGLAPLSLLINFDRSRSQPINPFDFNLTSATLTDSNGTTGTTTPQGTAKYVYGRARAYDIKTDQHSAPNPIELEVYSSSPTGYVSGMPQNVLYWYRNLNHNTLYQGILSGDDSATTTQTALSSTISINPSLFSPLNGLHNIIITNPDAISHAIVHLTIPPWLWYSTVVNYAVGNGTTCMQHPCFDYQYFGTTATNITGVNSGTFQGSDFTLTPAKKNINKGVKVFR